jgi:hypothetical protein
LASDFPWFGFDNTMPLQREKKYGKLLTTNDLPKGGAGRQRENYPTKEEHA